MNHVDRAHLDIPDLEASSRIPKVLNQIFLRGWDAVPEEIRDHHIPALRARNPDWRYRFFDAAGAVAFIEKHYGAAMLDIYESIDPAYYSARSDLLRYLIIYAEGGVYLDIKSDIIRPLDTFIQPDDAFLLSQWPADDPRYTGFGLHARLSHIPGGEYQQWFIIAALGHPFMRAVIERTIGNLASYRSFRDGVGFRGVLNATGPIAYTLAINPLVDKHPCRMIRALDDELLAYSHLKDSAAHKDSSHYTKLSHPIVPRNPILDKIAAFVFRILIKIRRLPLRIKK